MNINKKKQNINFKNQQYVFLMYYATNIYIFFSIFFFLIFHYWNFDIEIFLESAKLKIVWKKIATF